MRNVLTVGKLLHWVVACCLLTSCQYRFGHGELSQDYSTISVSYVEGDLKGDLTAEVIKRIGTSGAFRYDSSTCGDLLLTMKIIDFQNENIGFRYDRKKHGERKKVTIPTETRLGAQVEVIIKEGSSGRILRGPTLITASVDFDHDFYFTRDEENVFSLGQLNDIDAAEDAVMKPLNRHLAEKIVDYLTNSW